jgi:hypothetical protein
MPDIVVEKEEVFITKSIRINDKLDASDWILTEVRQKR